jgi:hypothetical protein
MKMWNWSGSWKTVPGWLAAAAERRRSEGVAVVGDGDDGQHRPEER